MKKLLSVFAAAAVLFGFASCSGDLLDGMDALPEAMYIIGNATAGGWAGAENQKMEKKGTTFSIDIDLVAGEYKFVSNNPNKMDDWSNVKTQWGANGAGSNQDSWKHTAPGRFPKGSHHRRHSLQRPSPGWFRWAQKFHCLKSKSPPCSHQMSLRWQRSRCNRPATAPQWA